MNHTPTRRLMEGDWTITGNNSLISSGAYPHTPRAVYSFQPRIRHIDYRRAYKSKGHQYDSTFPITSQFKDTEFFRKFPARKIPMSVRNKRPVAEFVDFLGTQMIYAPNKKNIRFY